MRIRINERNIELNKSEVQSAKKNAARILKEVRDLSKKRNLTSYYYTFLIVMHILTQELLNEFNAEDLENMMNRINNRKEKNEHTY